MKSFKNQTSVRPPVIGASSLLIIFAVLCLTMFTLLALSTAKANARLSNASINAISDYYEADRQAEMIFSQLRESPQFLPRTGIYKTDNIYSYSVPISTSEANSSYLDVALKYENDTWTVLRWQTVSFSASEDSSETLTK